jgi:transcriptional regulator with XRE-family HTH domain
MPAKKSKSQSNAKLRIPPRKIDKNGIPYYDLRVFDGYKNGKQIEKRKKYYPPDGLCREAQDQAAVRALQNLTVEVKGNASSPTFCTIAQQYLQTQELSPTTRARYADMLKLIAVNDWAHIPIGDITNKDLTAFYSDLTIKGVNENANYATGKNLRESLKDRNLTVAALSRMTGIAESTIRKAFDPDKHIQIQVADKIATALGKDINALFDVRDAEKGLSNRTIHHYHAFIRAVLGQALADGVILINVADQAHKAFPKRMKLKKKGVDPDRYLQQDEAQRLADAVRALPEEYYKW